MFDPESIEAALFALVQKGTADFGFKRVSRHAVIWTNLTPSDLPALQLIPDGFSAVQDREYGISKYEFQYLVLLHGLAQADPNSIPQQFLNKAAKAINDAFVTRPPGEAQKLKTQAVPTGLVENVWIDGMIHYAPGELVQNIAAVVPIRGITGR